MFIRASHLLNRCSGSGDDGEVAAAAQGRYSLRRREADGENVHHLTVGLTPVASGDHKGQRGGVNHDFQTNQHKQQIATDNQTG